MSDLIRTVLLILLAIPAFLAPARADIVVTDDTGETIHLLEPASRIISLAPNLTELLFAAGAGDKIVGTVQYSDYPEPAKSIQRIGDAYQFDIEAILQLQPDLIVYWQSGAGEPAYRKLKELGLVVYRAEPDTVEKIGTSLIRFGQLSGTEQTAEAASKQMLEQMNQLQQTYSGKPAVRVFYQFWNQPIYTVNGKHLISHIIELCGGQNIFAALSALTPQISPEEVLQANPDIIIASGENNTPPGWMNDWKQWSQLTANRNNRIYSIPPDYIQRHTPRIIEGARMMCDFIDQARQ